MIAYTYQPLYPARRLPDSFIQVNRLVVFQPAALGHVPTSHLVPFEEEEAWLLNHQVSESAWAMQLARRWRDRKRVWDGGQADAS